MVGTVIDPELSNQMRVTVVATGLGRPAAAAACAAARAPRERDGAAACASGDRARGCRRCAWCGAAALSSSDYAALDKPTIQRQRAVGDGLRAEADPEELLDIPAFLRRQAD